MSHTNIHIVFFSAVYIYIIIGCVFRMKVALEGLWQANCVLDPAVLGQTITDVAQAHFGVYVIYLSNADYQNRKLNQLM